MGTTYDSNLPENVGLLRKEIAVIYSILRYWDRSHIWYPLLSKLHYQFSSIPRFHSLLALLFGPDSVSDQYGLCTLIQCIRYILNDTDLCRLNNLFQCKLTKCYNKFRAFQHVEKYFFNVLEHISSLINVSVLFCYDILFLIILILDSNSI